MGQFFDVLNPAGQFLDVPNPAGEFLYISFRYSFHCASRHHAYYFVVSDGREGGGCVNRQLEETPYFALI